MTKHHRRCRKSAPLNIHHRASLQSKRPICHCSLRGKVHRTRPGCYWLLLLQQIVVARPSWQPQLSPAHLWHLIRPTIYLPLYLTWRWIVRRRVSACFYDYRLHFWFYLVFWTTRCIWIVRPPTYFLNHSTLELTVTRCVHKVRS